MVQTIASTTRNPWILHMRKCAIHYREEQAAKAKASARDEAPKPKRRLTKKTSPEEALAADADKAKADKAKASSKDEAPKPRRRLTKKTSPEEALAAAAAPPPPPVVAVQRRRILKKCRRLLPPSLIFTLPLALLLRLLLPNLFAAD